MLKDFVKERLQKYNRSAIKMKRIGSSILLFSFITLITIFLKAGASNEHFLIAGENNGKIDGIDLKDLLHIDINEMNLNEIHYPSIKLQAVEGKASWYGKRFHGRKTASGEKYNMNAYSAAHRKLAFGTIVKVTNTSNNKSTLVRINDRGPFVKNRIIDLSYKAANEIDGFGVPNLRIESLSAKEVETNTSQILMLCYSPSFELLSLPISELSILHTTDDFDKANEMLSLIQEEFPDERVYIAVASNYLSKNRKSQHYYLSTLSVNQDIYMKFKEIAELR